MNKRANIMAYFCLHYPHKNELSKARLTKLVYLSDWFSSLLDGKQLTNIDWVFNHYGPYVEDISSIAAFDDNFTITPYKTIYGGDKYVISCSLKAENVKLNPRESAILDAIIEKTKTMYFNDFIDYVYSTYPVTASERYTHFDLPALAKEYNKNS